MKRIASIGKGVVACGLAATVLVGVMTASTSRAAFRPCPQIECLDVWNPVICPNGKVYSNACYAARACQTGCVPY